MTRRVVHWCCREHAKFLNPDPESVGEMEDPQNDFDEFLQLVNPRIIGSTPANRRGTGAFDNMINNTRE